MKLLTLDNDAKIFNPAKIGDAGFDIVAKEDPRVIGDLHHHLFYKSIHHIEYNTSLRLEPEFDESINQYSFFLLLFPRSSIIKTNLVLANSVGVIDSGYRGDIKVCFKYIAQPEDMKIIEGKNFDGKQASGIVTSINPQRIYHKGDKIAQLIPFKHNKINIETVTSLSSSERNEGGFGSTGIS